MSGDHRLPGVIEIRGIRVLGHHGVEDSERERAQPFEVDLDIELDVLRAAADDDLAGTVDYGQVVNLVVGTVVGARFGLLERLADAIAGEVIERFGAPAVTVAIRKLRPPLAADVATVGVRVRRVSSAAGGLPGR